MKNTLLAIVLTLLGVPAWAQLEFSNFTATGRGGVATTFATDYQALGINPANLGLVRSFRDPLVTFGLGEYSVNFNAEAIRRQDLLRAIGEIASGRQGKGLSYQEKIEAGRRMANSELSTNIDVMPFGIGLHLKGNQGVAFSMRSHTQMYGRLNGTLTDLMFMGANSSYFDYLAMSNGRSRPNPRHPNNSNLPLLTDKEYEQVSTGFISNADSAPNLSDIMANSRLSATWWNEFNFGYGARIYDSYNFSLYGGLDLKVIRGILMMDYNVGSEGNIISNYFGLASGLVVSAADSLVLNPNPNFKQLLFPKDVSKGTGYTIGFTAVVKRNLYVGASLSNWRGFLGKNALPSLGQVLSSEQLYAMDNTPLLQFGGQGFSSYNMLATQPEQFAIGGDDSPFDWQKIEPRRVELPATLRVGMSYEFFRTVHFGADIIMPLNKALGNPSGPFFAIGGDFRLSRILRISSGFNTTLQIEDRQDGASIFKRPNIPLGVTYTSMKGNYEAGIASKDILTYIGNFDGSTVSFASGFVRFKLGVIKKYRE